MSTTAAEARVVAALIDALGHDAVITDPDAIQAYRRDRAEDPSAGTPLAVVRANRTEDVQAAVRIAAAGGIGVVPRGAGSGLSGGATAVDGALVVSLERMREVTIDPAMQMARVQPGAFNAEVKAAAAEHGLWYPPDPSSYEFCSIGGYNASQPGGPGRLKDAVVTGHGRGSTRIG